MPYVPDDRVKGSIKQDRLSSLIRDQITKELFNLSLVDLYCVLRIVKECLPQVEDED